jgi:phosphocarrier protein
VGQAARQTVEIINRRGLHARASAKFVAAVAAFDGCDVRVAKDGLDAAGGSILGLMMLGAGRGDTIEIAVTGNQAQARLDELVELVTSGFGED